MYKFTKLSQLHRDSGENIEKH